MGVLTAGLDGSIICLCCSEARCNKSLPLPHLEQGARDDTTGVEYSAINALWFGESERSVLHHAVDTSGQG